MSEKHVQPVFGGWPAGRLIRSGVVAGLLGGVCIWGYEAIVWVGIQHQMRLAGIPANATGLVFGKSVQASLGYGAHAVGLAIHFAFAAAWGVLLALILPRLLRRGWPMCMGRNCGSSTAAGGASTKWNSTRPGMA